MKILGITHPISWNPAAVLLDDGKIIAAVEEERFVRIKHAPRMIPHNSIEWILKESNLDYSDIDAIAISWDGPHTVNEIDDAVKKGELAGALKQWNEKDFWSESVNKETSLMNYLRKFSNAHSYFVKHHLAHAASACFVSGFKKSMFLTIDGRGEFESGQMGVFDNGNFEIIKSFDLRESLGNFYSSLTSIAGFSGHTDEGKLMGLAPYGTPIDGLKDILKVENENDIIIDWNKITSLENTFTESDPTKDSRKDIAATAQFLLENCVLKLVKYLKSVTGLSNLCLAGGSALNIDMNGMLLESGLIDKIFIQPASHDAGCALGSALIVNNQQSNSRNYEMKHAYLGPDWQDNEIETILKNTGLNYRQLDNVPLEIAELLSNNQVVSWMQGKLEFGPRGLGSRSLLANPTDCNMWTKVNKLKGREYWRPLAPSIIEEETDKYFKNHGAQSPFMLLKFHAQEKSSDIIPAVVHIDNSARPQTVSKETNPLYWKLLKEFQKIKGVPVLINTSLNLRGEPIVNSPYDALKTFYSSNIDHLCINNFLISKY